MIFDGLHRRLTKKLSDTEATFVKCESGLNSTMCALRMGV